MLKYTYNIIYFSNKNKTLLQMLKQLKILLFKDLRFINLSSLLNVIKN